MRVDLCTRSSRRLQSKQRRRTPGTRKVSKRSPAYIRVCVCGRVCVWACVCVCGGGGVYASVGVHVWWRVHASMFVHMWRSWHKINHSLLHHSMQPSTSTSDHNPTHLCFEGAGIVGCAAAAAKKGPERNAHCHNTNPEAQKDTCDCGVCVWWCVCGVMYVFWGYVTVRFVVNT